MTRRLERLVLEAYVEGKESKKQIARRFDISEQVVTMLLRGAYRFAPGAGEDETTPELREAVAARKLAWQTRLIAGECASRANTALQQAIERRAAPMLEALERTLGGRPAVKPDAANSQGGAEAMGAFIIPEEAESGLSDADRALAAFEGVLTQLGEAQLEIRCDEIAALIALVPSRLNAAREQARFDARAA